MGDDGRVRPVFKNYCPLEDIHPWLLLLVDYHEHYVAGHMLEAGGVMDQQAWYLDAMLIFQRAYGRARKRDDDKMRRDAEAARRR